MCPVDLRVIAATSADLLRRVADGSFSGGFVLSAECAAAHPAAAAPAAGRPAQPVRIHPGPAGGKTGSLPRDIDSAALALLREQRWPGNLRQLRNTLEQAVAMTDGDTLAPPSCALSARPPGRAACAPWPTWVAATERQMIQAALVEQQGRAVDAARQLGLTRHAV